MSVFRPVKITDSEIISTLRLREMRIINVMNRFRLSFFLLTTLFSLLYILRGKTHTDFARFWLILSIAVIPLALMVHQKTKKGIHHPWMIYLSTFWDAAINFAICAIVIKSTELPFPVDKVGFMLTMIPVFLFFNALSALQTNRVYIIFSTLLFSAVMTTTLIWAMGFTGAILFSNILLFLSGVFNLWVSGSVLNAILANHKLQTANRHILRQKEEIEEKNRDITAGINYALRIQEAALPAPEMIRDTLPDHFILFKPRDIVSGDFYWVKRLDRYILVAAADCTGHGVPGAFVSMLGIALLNEIAASLPFQKEKGFNAAYILEELRNRIKSSLKQKRRECTNRDGMDIAFCIIDTEKKTMQYAGAYNPLYILSLKETGDGGEETDFKEIKATRSPIGIHFKEKPFVNHEISMDRGAVYYIFSDGFADQLGGEKGEKFKTGPFKRLLASIHHHSTAKQKQLLEQTLAQWMNFKDEDGEPYTQVDDILVIGIRL